jgi:ubiquinone/menaquinone biosynthesis C-methylase UbiE
MRQKKAEKIHGQVKTTYDTIGEDFDETRQIPVKEFALFEPYIKPDMHVLDLGCGNGRLLKSLIGCGYLGMDGSETMVRLAKKNFPHGNFVKGDMLEIPAKDGTFDLVFNIRAFHHLPGKQMRLAALAEINRVLRPNGVMVITVWNMLRGQFWKQALKAILRSIFTLGNYSWKDFFIPWGKKAKRYYHAFTPMELLKLVTNSGFEIEELFSVKDGQKVPLKVSHDIVIIARKNGSAKTA